MTTFIRQLKLAGLSAEVLAENPLADLFSNWRPAGVATVFSAAKGGAKPDIRISSLRLAVRDGYINFYCGGQSVAKVTFGTTDLTASVHVKYLEHNQKSKSEFG